MASSLSLPSTTETAGDSDSESDISGDNVGTPEQLKTVLLLDRLKAPRASDLARKRKVHSNPPLGKKRSSGRLGAEEAEDQTFPKSK